MLFILLADLGHAAVVEDRHPAHVTVAICDKSGAATSTLEVARDEVSLILRQGGIAVEWVDSAGIEGAPTFSVGSLERCPITRSDVDLLVIIAPGSPEGWSPAGLGFAQANARPMPRAYVLVDRVSALALEYTSGDIGVLLGNVIAHELGHLLMPDRGHTSGGIMTSSWGYPEVAAAIQGTLEFNSWQVAQMRERVLSLE
jgi:hypothetical protein